MTGSTDRAAGTGISTTGAVGRRTVLRCAALTVGGAALAACGDGGQVADSGAAPAATPSGPPPASGPPGGATSSAPPSGPVLAALDDVPEGSALAVTSAGGPLLLVRTSGDAVSAYSAVCPHQQCTVAPLGDRLVCPCHASTFDPASGAVLQGPATSDLTAVPVTVVDGNVVQA